MRRPLVLWILAVLITLASVIYQRMTGPTHPVRGSIHVQGETIKFKLPRSHVTTQDAQFTILASQDVTGEIRWRRFRSNDAWTTDRLTRRGDSLIVTVPKQPSAGKVIYQIALIDAKGAKHTIVDTPVIMRFKDPVPWTFLGPHMVIMFAAMLLATRTGLEAAARGRKAYLMTVWTSVLLFVGGIILGHIVQKYAFGAYWTGWPLGHDLTDTKTAAAMLFWIIALWRGRSACRGQVWIIIAAVVTLLVYLIPHSAYGSELDYTAMGD